MLNLQCTHPSSLVGSHFSQSALGAMKKPLKAVSERRTDAETLLTLPIPLCVRPTASWYRQYEIWCPIVLCFHHQHRLPYCGGSLH